MRIAEKIVVGDNLKVIYIGGKEEYVTITGIDDIKYRNVHDPISAGSTEAYTEVTDLDPPPGQLYWIGRIVVDGNVKVYLKQPAATDRWGTNKSPSGGLIEGLPQSFSDDIALETDIWIAEDYPPSVQITNDTPVSITPVLWWYGKRFSYQTLSPTHRRPPVRYYTIKIGGISD